MQLIWKVTASDAKRVRAFVDSLADTPMVKARLRSAASQPRLPTRAALWRHMVTCLLTTQQRSGPNSAIARFVAGRPFPLTYKTCRSQPGLADHVERVLKEAGGIRFSRRIGNQLAANLEIVQGEGWSELTSALRPLTQKRSTIEPATERAAALVIQQTLAGIGPKQSRNLLQLLELSQYEIPIDSRITKWLNEFGFPIRLSAGALGDLNYYCFVSDGLQQLCAKAGVLPCVLDAAIFTSFDQP